MTHPHPLPIRLKENCEHSLRSAQLRGNLTRFHNNYAELRKRNLAQRPDWEALRQKAHDIKKDAIENLDKNLECFTQKIVERGGHVHWAQSGEEAVRYILELIKRNGIQLAVKSKSMVTEEISLNTALQRHGIEVLETDLGEYILQLGQEHPSHIVMPAVHKSKQQIARLFEEKFKETYTGAEEITAKAAAILRRKFKHAGIGISGVNFGVAESGSIVIVENEGNVRFTTTVPKIHVALMGIEKCIPSFASLAPLLTLLPRCGTGQQMTVYVNILTGPRRPTELDGPEEFHLILLDNARSSILADPQTRQSLYCIRCGACLNVCPVYLRIGGHAYGWTYPGPIGALVTPQMVGLANGAELPFASSLCGACGEVCPVKIPIPDILLRLRQRVQEGAKRERTPNRMEALAMRAGSIILQKPFLYQFASALARLLQMPMQDGAIIPDLPGPLSAWTRKRNFPALAKRPFRSLWKEHAQWR